MCISLLNSYSLCSIYLPISCAKPFAQYIWNDNWFAIFDVLPLYHNDKYFNFATDIIVIDKLVNVLQLKSVLVQLLTNTVIIFTFLV